MMLPGSPKPIVVTMWLTLALLPCWQVAEATDMERTRHSLIHRPQIQTTPVLKAGPSLVSPQPNATPLTLSTPSQPLHRKIARRPTVPSPAVAQATTTVSTGAAQTDTSPTLDQSIPDEETPEPELEPERLEHPGTEAR